MPPRRSRKTKSLPEPATTPATSSLETNAVREPSVIHSGDMDVTMEDVDSEQTTLADQRVATVPATATTTKKGRRGGEGGEKETASKSKVGRKRAYPKRAPSFKRGKYKPRERKDWVWQFKPYLLKSKEDGSMEVRVGEKRNLPRARPDRCRITRTRKRIDYMGKLLAKSNAFEAEPSNWEEGGSSSSTAPPETETTEGGENSSTINGSQAMPTMVAKLIRRHAGPKTESNDPNSSVWYVDPPRMEYPYLQEPFPYEEYERTHPEPLPGALHNQSGYTSRLGPLLSPEIPLPDTWYRPQGPVPPENHFSLDKLKDATDLVKTIKVDTEGLRMDVYYNRGFELASRRILDRIRARRAVKMERDEEKQTRQKAMEARAELRRTWQTALLGNNPEADEILAGRHISWFRDIAKSMTMEAAQKAAKEQETAATAAARAEAEARGAVPVESSVAESLSTLTSTLEGRPATLQSSVSASSSSSSPSSSSSSSSAPAPGELPSSTSSSAAAPTSNADAAEEEEEEEEEEQQEEEPEGEVPLTDYYQVNAFLASLFQLKGRSLKDPLPLGPGASRIIQTLLLGLETKIMAMGCHLQREELMHRMTVKAGDAAFALEVARTMDLDRKILKSASIKKQQQQAFEDLQRAPLPSGATPSWTNQLDAALPESKNEIERLNPLRQPASYSPYYRLGVFDPDLFMLKTTSQDTVSSTRAGTSQLASPQPSVDTPTLTQSAFESPAGASSSSNVTPVDEAASAQAGSNEEFSTSGSNQFKMPFVGNPLEIFPSMDPFWLAREYQFGLVKRQQAQASSSTPAAPLASAALSESPADSSSASTPAVSRRTRANLQAPATETEDSMDMEL